MDGFGLLDGHQADDGDVGGGDDVVALPSLESGHQLVVLLLLHQF